MRLLIVSNIYHPSLSPRAFRWTTLAEHWASRGHEVDVVCGWKPGLSEDEEVNGVRIRRVGRGITEALRARLLGGTGGSAESSAGAIAPRRSGLRAVAKWVHDHTWKKLYWPDYACLWCFPATRACARLLSGRHYDAMISVSDPFTSQIVGMRLKRRMPSLRWIADIGDPFCYRDRTQTNNHRLYSGLNYAVERRIFRLADAISVTTGLTAARYRELFPESAGKVRVIPPLVSLPVESDVPHQPLFASDGKIRLVFLGTLYKEIRNPRYLLRLFSRLLQADIGSRLELHMFGDIHDCGECFDECGSLMGDKIVLHGLVGREIAGHALREADVLVNIGNDTTYQLPSKVVEYASTGSRVLNLVKSAEDSSVEFFESYPAALTLVEGDHAPGQFDELLGFVRDPRPRVEGQELERLLSGFAVEQIADGYIQLLVNREELQ